MEIEEVWLLDENGTAVTELESGEALQVKIRYNAPQLIEEPIFGVTISRQHDGLVCYDTSTAAAGMTPAKVEGQGEITLCLERLDLIAGDYSIDVGVYERDWHYAYDYHWRVYLLEILGSGAEKGVIRPPHRWALNQFRSQKEPLPQL